MIQRIINKLGRLYTEGVFQIFPNKVDFIKNKQNQILMYHGVVSKTYGFNYRHIKVSDFEKHISFLKRYCNVITLEDFFLKKFVDDKPNIAITFDDGYRNNFVYAKPILEKYQVPATFFVTGINKTNEDILWADFLNIVSFLKKDSFVFEDELFSKKGNAFYNDEGKKIDDIIKKQKSSYEYKMQLYDILNDYNYFKKSEDFEEYWKLMSDEEIRICAKSNFISIGSHGFYHNNLGSISFENASDELLMSKNYLEQIIDKKINSIAYPDGSYTRDLVRFSDSIGLVNQLAVNYIFPEDKLDERICDRKGIYNCDTCGNMLIR